MGPDNQETSAAVDDDGALLLRVADGNRLAFEQLHARTFSRITRIAQRYVGRRHDVEELVQEIYLTVWTRAGQFDPARGGARAWMATATRNRCVDWIRAHDARQRADRLDSADTWDLHEEIPATELNDELDQLRQRLNELSQQRQQMIRRSFFDGATHDEIATTDGVPLGTVKSTIRRALRQLRRVLDPR